MATNTLQFEFRVGGVLTNATSVVLSDPTGAFGVRRTDTSAVVVADAVAMTNAATGVYTYSFTEPATGLTYEWYAEWVYAGVTNRAQFYSTGSTTDLSAVEGDYIDGQDIANKFGTDNVTKWSQLDNTLTTANTTRIASAISYAEAEINGFFRDSRYAVPLAFNSGSAIRDDWAATIAGVWLYGNRGQQDDVNQYAEMLNATYADMRAYKAGVKRLDATLAYSDMPTAPIVV